jgi:hypothetical protein
LNENTATGFADAGCSLRDHIFWDNFRQTIRRVVKILKESRFFLFNDLGLRIPVLAGKQKLRGHVQGALRADIITLGAENALGDIDTDTLCFGKKFNGVCRTYPKAERTSDA